MSGVIVVVVGCMWLVVRCFTLGDGGSDVDLLLLLLLLLLFHEEGRIDAMLNAAGVALEAAAFLDNAAVVVTDAALGRGIGGRLDADAAFAWAVL